MNINGYIFWIFVIIIIFAIIDKFGRVIYDSLYG